MGGGKWSMTCQDHSVPTNFVCKRGVVVVVVIGGNVNI